MPKRYRHYTEIGIELSDFRTRTGITNTQIAKELGITPQHITNVCIGLIIAPKTQERLRAYMKSKANDTGTLLGNASLIQER